MSDLERLGAGRIEGARARAGDALELPGLRDERHRLARPSGRARRPQAGAPPDPLRDGGGRPAAEPAAGEVGERRRRRDEELPPAWRLGHLRHPRSHGADVLDALSARRPAGELREHRRLPGRGDALHRGTPRADRDRAAPRHRRRHRRLRPQLRRATPRALGPTVAVPEPARQRLRGDRRRHGDQHPAAQPRRGDRRGGGDDRRPGHQRRAPEQARQGPRLPDRRDHPRPRGDPRGVPVRAAAASSCARGRTSRSCAAARPRSSSPSFHTG